MGFKLNLLQQHQNEWYAYEKQHSRSDSDKKYL